MTEISNEIIGMTVGAYIVGIFAYSGLSTIILYFIFKSRSPKFLSILLHCSIGGLIGVLIAGSAFGILKPTDVVYGQLDWEAKMDFQVDLYNSCLLLPIGTILIASFYSFWTQLKVRAATSKK